MEEKEYAQAELDTDEMKTTLSSKFSNFWYFYKWQTILFVIIGIGIIAAIIQMSENNPPDTAVMYVGPAYLTVKDKEEMADLAENYMRDYNEDGIKNFTLLDITVTPMTEELDPYKYQINGEARKRFEAEVMAGDSLVYILEESFYRVLVEQNALMKLSDVLDSDMIPDSAEEYGVKVKYLDFFDSGPFASFYKEAYICIKSKPNKNTINYGTTPEYWESNKVFFRSVFAYKK